MRSRGTALASVGTSVFMLEIAIGSALLLLARWELRRLRRKVIEDAARSEMSPDATLSVPR